MSKYGVFSGPYFPVFSPNIEKYGPEKTPYLDTFHEMTYDGTFLQKELIKAAIYTKNSTIDVR